jgi:hypothetical protein
MTKYARIDLAFEDCSGYTTEEEFDEAYVLFNNSQNTLRDCLIVIKTKVFKEVDASFDHEFGTEKRTEAELRYVQTSVQLMEDLDVSFDYKLSKRDWSASYQKNKYPETDELFITNIK